MSGMPNSPDGARERLSVLMDGEFLEEGHEAAFATVIGQDTMAEDWAVYHCIGDVLRSSDMGCHSARLVQSVGERLRDEPHLLSRGAHAGGARGGYMRPLSALAAVAAVAAVGVVIWPQIGNQAAPVVAATAPAAPASPAPGQASRIAPVSVEYLAAHRQFSAGSTLRGSFAAQGQTVAYESAR